MAGGARLLLLLVVLVAAGCGAGNGSNDSPREHADPPAPPPRGWKSVRNEVAGFTVSVPRSWTARVRRAATLIRSKDRLLVLTVAPDRGQEGREVSPTAYARRVFDALPGFERTALPRRRRVSGSPYRAARVDGAGRLQTSKRPQRITVVAYQRPGRVTYAAVVFFNPKLPDRLVEPRLRRILRSFRAQPPRPS